MSYMVCTWCYMLLHTHCPYYVGGQCVQCLTV